MKFILIVNVILLCAFVRGQQNDVMTHNYGNISSIREILEIFSIEYVGSDWMNIHTKMSRQCSDDMTKYLNGLSQKRVWAIKSKFSYHL